MECSKDYPLTDEDIAQLKDKQFPDKDDVRCLFACAYKKTGMMDDQGKLSVDGVNNLAKKYFSDDQDKLQKSQKFTEACAGVNDEAVTDGEKGCERAALIYKCSIEQASQGLTDEEVKKEFIKEVMTCTKDITVDMFDLMELEQLKVPTKTNVKCVLACAYKRVGTMNKEGKYDIKEAYKISETMMKGDDKRIENGKKLADLCSKVNEADVRDGNKGCERAALLFKCVIENAPKLGFKV
ncbi:odorant binding protein [Danaus plexippus plexippus]|uniref:Odorant binding protein n=1 Tax=Danaus plexippus plexippus TaxID=278856 RepID=A0A212ET95_DANPL|nr:odorant binding protein [Danaus plexippus plexippus]